MMKVPIWHNLTDIHRTHILLIEEKSGQKDSFLLRNPNMLQGHTLTTFSDMPTGIKKQPDLTDEGSSSP